MTEPSGSRSDDPARQDSGTTPRLSRSGSFSSASASDYDWEFPPIEKLTTFDFLDNLALPQAIERINRQVVMRTESFLKSTEKVKEQYEKQKNRVINNIEFEKYKQKYQDGLDKLMEKWGDTKVSKPCKRDFFTGLLGLGGLWGTCKRADGVRG